MRHHAFVVEAEIEEGIRAALAWTERELELDTNANNPDIAVLRYGLFTVADARRVLEIAAGAPFVSEYKVVIIAASRVFHEAQNALLKLFEEPPPGTFLFFIMPSLGGLLSTLRSRVQILNPYRDVKRPTLDVGRLTSHTSNVVEEFVKADKEKRSAIIKKLTSGKDEEERRALRDEAIALVNSIEAVAYRNKEWEKNPALRALLGDLGVLREYLYDRSAPVKMILEHLSLVFPKGLV